jgi:hypothetical protein
MEDWAYAGSWDRDRVISCQPEQYGGYPSEKTVYEDGTLRAFNMLVEGSNYMRPSSYNLGTSAHLMTPDKSVGHIPRNMRLAWLAADLVEPYVIIKTVNGLNLSDDIVPLTERGGTSCQEARLVRVPRSSNTVEVKWTVGGALEIDMTQLWYTNVGQVSVDCLIQPESAHIEELMNMANPAGPLKGTGQFSLQEPSPTHFKALIDISQFEPGDNIVVFASAQVDRSWAEQAENVGPADVPPQSHIVNARTNPHWYHESGGRIIRGRRDWFSIPLTFEIGADEDETVELTSRHDGFSLKPIEAPSTPVVTDDSSPEEYQNRFNKIGAVVLLATAAVALVVGSRALLHQRTSQRINVREFLEKEIPSPGKTDGYVDVPMGLEEDDDGSVIL